MSQHVFAEYGAGLKFVGDFDALYLDDPDPWEQSGEGQLGDYYEASRRTLVEVLSRHAFGRGLEVGCGHGHVTAYLQGRLRAQMMGMDISRAAVAKATELHHGPRFVVGDITSFNFGPPGRFRFLIWGECWWYLLEKFDQAVENSLRCIDPGGVLAVSQAFLRGEQRYGADIADGFHGALRLFGDRFGDRLSLIEARYDDSDKFTHRDGLLVFRVT